MDRVQAVMATDLSRQLEKVDTGSSQSAGKSVGGGQAVEVKDTVTISKQAKELAAGGKRAPQPRYVPATGTVLMPGESTTVKINVTG